MLSYLPDSNKVAPPYEKTSDSLERRTTEIDTLLRKAFNSPTGFNTPIEVSILIQQVCDHGDFFEIQPDRARNAITAFGRLGGNVVGFVANNSAVALPKWQESAGKWYQAFENGFHGFRDPR